MAPILVAQIAERGLDLAHVLFDAFEIVKNRTLPHMGADARDERPGIIDDKAADRRVRFRRQQLADTAAHRGADPVNGFGAGARDERRHVRKRDPPPDIVSREFLDSLPVLLRVRVRVFLGCFSRDGVEFN